MIKFPNNKPNTVSELKQMWQTCFGDDMEYIDLFFSNFFTPENTLVYYYEEKAVAMLFLLPAKLQIKNISYDVQYLYAACTLPEFRKKLIMSELINYAKKLGASRKVFATVLLPAKKSLYDYYQKRGFETAFSKKIVTINRNVLKENSKINNIKQLKYCSENTEKMRNESFKNQDGIKWDKNHIDYAFKTNEFLGGVNFVCEQGYAIISIEDEFVEIVEHTFSSENISILFSYLLDNFNVDKFKFNLNPDYKFLKNTECQIIDYGMISQNSNDKNFDFENNVYNMHLSLALD